MFSLASLHRPGTWQEEGSPLIPQSRLSRLQFLSMQFWTFLPKKKLFTKASVSPGAKPNAELSLHRELWAALHKSLYLLAPWDPTLAPSAPSLVISLSSFPGSTHSHCSVSPAQGLKMLSPHWQPYTPFCRPDPLNARLKYSTGHLTSLP